MASLLKMAFQVLLATTLLCGTAYAQQPKVDEELELQFNGHCRECHSFVKNDNRLGPSLYGVVGRKAGSVPGFNYSNSVRDSGIVWMKRPPPFVLSQWAAADNGSRAVSALSARDFSVQMAVDVRGFLHGSGWRWERDGRPRARRTGADLEFSIQRSCQTVE